MKTALNQLMERVEFIKLYYENELTLNYEPHVMQILDGKLSVTENILKEIESLLPTERETTETLKKEIDRYKELYEDYSREVEELQLERASLENEIEELRKENEKIFEVDFGNHLRTKIKVIDRKSVV